MKLEKRFDLSLHREEEAFLEEQHAKGWRVQSKRNHTYTFEKTEPLETEYLIEIAEFGNDLLSWEAYREHLGFTKLFIWQGQHYMFRKKQDERFEKKDQLLRETMVQKRLIARLLRIFFFLILGFVTYSAPVPRDKIWVKFFLALISVVGVASFGLLSLGDMQLMKKWQKF